MNRATLARIEASLKRDVEAGVLKPQDVERERARRVAAETMSPPRSYPDTITNPVDPPTVGDTSVTRPI